MVSLQVPPVCRWGNVAMHCSVGVVRSPCIGSMLGEPMWTCRLLLTGSGYSACTSPASSKVLFSQENFTLKCRGLPFVQYSTLNLREGSLVHVVAKVYKKPRFVPIHGTYVEDTELLLSEQFGSLVFLGQL